MMLSAPGVSRGRHGIRLQGAARLPWQATVCQRARVVVGHAKGCERTLTRVQAAGAGIGAGCGCKRLLMHWCGWKGRRWKFVVTANVEHWPMLIARRRLRPRKLMRQRRPGLEQRRMSLIAQRRRRRLKEGRQEGSGGRGELQKRCAQATASAKSAVEAIGIQPQTQHRRVKGARLKVHRMVDQLRAIAADPVALRRRRRSPASSRRRTSS